MHIPFADKNENIKTGIKIKNKKKLEAYNSSRSVSGNGELVVALVILVKKIWGKKQKLKYIFISEKEKYR